MAAGAWLRYPSSQVSLSPLICLCAGDTLPPEASAMPSGYDNSVNSISVGNKDKERGWATAGVLHRLDYCRSFTVRIYMVICRLTCSLKLGENKNSKVKVQCLSFQMWPFHIEINPSKCLLNDTEPRPQHFLTKFSSTFQPDSDLHIFQPQPSCIQILMSRNKVGNTL